MYAWRFKQFKPASGRRAIDGWKLSPARRAHLDTFLDRIANKELNMMAGCTHKGKVYDPPGIFETLDRRRRQARDGIGGLSEYTIRSS